MRTIFNVENAPSGDGLRSGLSSFSQNLNWLGADLSSMPTNDFTDLSEIRLDEISRTVFINGEYLELSRQEFALLQTFTENADRVLSRQELKQMLYGEENDINSNVLEVYIHSLRKKLGHDFIRTIRGIGYVVRLAKNS